MSHTGAKEQELASRVCHTRYEAALILGQMWRQWDCSNIYMDLLHLLMRLQKYHHGLATPSDEIAVISTWTCCTF